LDKPEYIVPQEGNSGNYNNTTTTDAEVPTKTTSGGIPIEELIKDPKLINKRVWQLAGLPWWNFYLVRCLVWWT